MVTIFLDDGLSISEIFMMLIIYYVFNNWNTGKIDVLSQDLSLVIEKKNVI